MTLAEPKTRLWKREEFYRLADQGWFARQRVQLINGEIIEMAPQGHSHTRSTQAALEALIAIFGAARIRVQMPLNAPGESDPEPDVAVTEKNFRDYAEHPTTALLVVEVADMSLALDRRKAGLYALAGVQEYWIVNVSARRLEVYRSPQADSGSEFGAAYSDRSELGEEAVVSPLSAPGAKIMVSSLF
jgi:Uma2 family endonuclease